MSNTFTPSAEQAAIIEHPDESLKVAAGAGTGKTTTIVMRIAALVESGVDPARILGVTFTNKAADELNQRVIEAISSDDKTRMPEISTYHGFAAAILDEFGAYVGYEKSTMLMDEGHRSELASRVLRTIDSKDLDLTSLSSRRSEMLALAASLTDNLVDIDTVRRAATLSAVDDAVADVWRSRLALLDAVEVYEQEKLRLGLLEYGDLIRLAVRAVDDSDALTEAISERYDAVVLDEYQDTDPAQRRLLTQLFASRVPVTAVGDTDQTIYEWRGASAQNFEAFPMDFPRTDGTPAATLPLSKNRRSDRVILDLANRIRDEIPHGEGALPLSPADEAKDGELATAWFNTAGSEADWIATEILRSQRSGSKWRDTAVLCRNRSHFVPIVEAFDALGIPYSVGSMGELLDTPEVADLLAWLRLIDKPSEEPSMLRILLGGRFRTGMSAIASLRTWCSDNTGSTLFDAALAIADIEDIPESSRLRISTFVELHQRLVHESQVLPIAAVVENTINSLGYWNEVAALEQGPALTAQLNINRFTELAQHWRPIEGAPNLAGFLRYLTALSESRRADELASAMPVNADAVPILTVHSAKGLEWPTVYVPSVANRVFPSSARAYDDPDRITRLLPYELRLDATIYGAASAASGKHRIDILRSRHLEQEWRLAYVATTRAAQKLVITGHGWDGGIKNARKPSPLWELARTTAGSVTGPMELVSDAPIEPEPFIEPPTPPDPLFEDGPAAALRRSVVDPGWIANEHPDIASAVTDRVEQLTLAVEDLASPALEESTPRFAVSVTNLVALAACAQRFKWIHHDRLPRKPRRSAVLGTAFHRRVELHNLGVIAFDDPGAASYDSPESAGGSVDGQSGSRGDPWDLFEGSRFSSETPIHIEAPFEVSIGEGSIRGKVDAIYETDEAGWEIVDYKSGASRADDARKVQLEAYAIAASEGSLSAEPPEAMSVTFAYFGGTDIVEVSEGVDDAWLGEARSRIERLVDQGINGPFDPTPSNECRWCDFLHLCPAGQQQVNR